MKTKSYAPYSYGFLAIIFGVETCFAYSRQAVGEMVLYGVASVASVGLVFYHVLSREP